MDTTAAYEVGFANGYGTEAISDTEFATLAETQSWETGYDAGRVARADDDRHRAARGL